MRYFLSGANGALGQLVQKHFPKDADLVLGVRNKALFKGTQEARGFDYQDLSLMKESLKGIDCLLFISSNSKASLRVSEQKNVVKACLEAGVMKVIYLSFITAALKQSFFDFTLSHVKTEEELLKSGLKSVFIRPSWYMENLEASLKEAKLTHSFCDASGTGRLSFVAKEDVAKAMVTAALKPDAKQVYTITGKKAYSLPEVALLCSEVLGVKVRYEGLSVGEMKELYLKAGLPEFLASSLAINAIGVDRGEYEGVSDDFDLLQECQRVCLKDFVKQSLS